MYTIYMTNNIEILEREKPVFAGYTLSGEVRQEGGEQIIVRVYGVEGSDQIKALQVLHDSQEMGKFMDWAKDSQLKVGQFEGYTYTEHVEDVADVPIFPLDYESSDSD